MLQNTVTPRKLARSESTIASILAAALRLFVQRNYAEVTMNQIARAGRVTKGALYHHFAGKEELYLAMMKGEFAHMRELFGAALSAGSTCQEHLRNLVETFFGLAPDKREVMKLVRRDINIFAEPARSELIAAYQSCLPQQVERVMAEGVASGELAAADPRLLSWQFVAAVEVILTPYADRVFRSAEEKLDYVIHLFFCGAMRTAGDAS